MKRLLTAVLISGSDRELNSQLAAFIENARVGDEQRVTPVGVSANGGITMKTLLLETYR